MVQKALSYRFSLVAVCAAALSLLPLQGQTTFNLNPSRSLGHARQVLQPDTGSPNLIEGREFFAPQAVALDNSVSPPILYVADTLNSRVLAWRSAPGFANGSQADLVIGQRNRFSTQGLGPGTPFTSGLTQPAGVAVDALGNLFVLDLAQNRVVRYTRPFQQLNQGNEVITASLVLGQGSFDTNTVNIGGRVSARGLRLNVAGSPRAHGSLAFDSDGNLWVTDPGNNRVVRFSAADVQGTVNGPDATVVLGQPDFSTATAAPTTAAGVISKTTMNRPVAVAVDSVGRVYVADSLGRTLQFEREGGQYTSGQAARRILGIYVRPATGALPAINEFTQLAPQGLFTLGEVPFVVDTGANRIMRYDPPALWEPESQTQISPPARAVFPPGAQRLAEARVNNGAAEPSGATLQLPFNAATSGPELYIADTGNNRVLALPLSGTDFGPGATRVLGQVGFEFNAINFIEGREFSLYLGAATVQGISGSYSDGAGLAVDTRSSPPRLYVADTYNNRVLGFRDARNVKAGDRADVVIGQVDLFRNLVNSPANNANTVNATGLNRPAGLAVDASGNLYIADSFNGRVLRFPSPFSRTEQRPDLVLGQDSFTVRVTDATQRTMNRPFGLAFTNDGHLLVSDKLFHRVLFFRKPDGADFRNGQAAEKVFGQPDFFAATFGTDDARLALPHHIATDIDDRLYIADAGNNRIVIYGSVTAAPERGATPVFRLTGLRNPLGVSVNRQSGDVFVANTGGSQVLRYQPFGTLVGNTTPTLTLPSGAPLLAVQDGFNNLFVADGFNRVAQYFPAATALNAANFLPRNLAPGQITALFASAGTSFTEGGDFAIGGFPGPTELGDVQVLLNEQPVVLLFAGPGQINFIVPLNAPASGTAELQVVQRSTGRIFASTTVTMNNAAPALFTTNSQGTGQVAAINQDGTVNGPGRGVPRGQVITLYGTGQGPVANAPPEGLPANTAVPTDGNPIVVVGTQQATVEYSGLAPTLLGVWQINVRVPNNVAVGDSVEVAVRWRDINSNQNPQGQITRRTFIAVR